MRDIESGWAYNDSVRLHYLDSRPIAVPSLTPIVFIPGRLGAAEDYVATEFAGLAPRRCVAASLRGRGGSDAPSQGYAFEDHVADVAAVLAHLRLNRFCLMGYSLGVPCALGYALQQPQGLVGMIVADYPAWYPALSDDWADRVLAANPQRAKPVVARALQRDAKEVLLWESLPRIRVPVLVLRGALPGALLTEDAAEIYKQKLQHARVVVLEDSAHELWTPEYLQALREFMETLDDCTEGQGVT